MKKLYCLLLFFYVCAPKPSLAASPWLPPPGQLDLALGLSQQKYDELWEGNKRTKLPGTVTMWFQYLGFVYGISDRVAIDLQTGYSETNYTVGTRGNLGGRIDTEIGLLYRVWDESNCKCKPLPTLTLRFGGTLQGNYRLADAGNLQAPGDGVSGTQFSVLAGKFFPKKFAAFAELGYRYRGYPVPNAFFGNVGILQTPIEHWTWSVSYQNYHATSGIDIGSPPFTGQIGKFGFQATKEQTGFINGSLMYSFTGGQSISLIYGQALHGRNSAVSKIITLFVNLPFQLTRQEKIS